MDGAIPSTAEQFPPQQHPTIAVVIGSGGIKTFAALALYEFLEEIQLQPDLLIGCSGGAIMTALYATGHSAARMKELIPELLNRELFARINYRTLLGLLPKPFARFNPGDGFINPDRLRALHRKLWGDTRLEDLQPKTIFQVTDFSTGEGLVLEHGLLADAVYASGASYPALPPLFLDGRWLVDGCCTSPCPVLEGVKRHIDIIIALTIESKFSTEPESFQELFSHGQNLCGNILTRNQMATAINLHHYEIIQVNVAFDRIVEFWNFEEIPYVIEAGHKAVAAKKADILAAIANFSAYLQNETGARF